MGAFWAWVEGRNVGKGQGPLWRRTFPACPGGAGQLRLQLFQARVVGLLSMTRSMVTLGTALASSSSAAYCGCHDHHNDDDDG